MSLLCRLLALDSAERQHQAGMANKQPEAKVERDQQGRQAQPADTHSKSVFPRDLHSTDIGTSPQAFPGKSGTQNEAEAAVSHQSFDD